MNRNKLLIMLMLSFSIMFTGCTVNDAQAQAVSSAENQEITENLTDEYDIVRVVDGDTYIIDIDGIEERVRLIGVDTPESVHPNKEKNTEEGKKASEYAKELLKDKKVRLEYDVQERDKYGRILAYVYLDGEMLNKKLLEEGWAKIATFPPNVKYVDDFKAITESLKEDEEGEYAQTDNVDDTYTELIGNSSSMKCHLQECTSVDKIAEYNKSSLKSVKQAQEEGYSPCGNCRPW